MKRRAPVLKGICLLLAAFAVLIPAATALGFQQEEIPTGFLGAMVGVMFLVFAVLYVYFSLALQTIAKKTNTENAWLAWIPIANVILMLNIAKKPLWWFILCLIPFVNIVITIIVWMAIAEARRKPGWWGILLIVPVVGLIVPGYLAWSD
ncbi:MAG TPA: DUF5684 domain-containing protein [Terriglobia bacterium]|nr:DUF5684 domain-containing protein [Terriglobia bacterium]